MSDQSFEKLVEDALNAHFEGWDFSYLNNRCFWEALPWSYNDYARVAIRNANTLLDLGTGGGEVLASFAPLPVHTFATEGYLPNVEIARERLGPLGVQVIDTSNDPAHIHLPFPNEAFDLITDRHTGANANELWRCLRESGSYITQQVGDQNCIAFNEWFGDTSRKDNPRFDLSIMTEQLIHTEFTLVDAQEAYPKTTYRDIGAVVYHLKAIPWMVPDFDVKTHHTQLVLMHEHMCKYGGFTVTGHRFFIHIRKSIY